eukprot:CAMPEP_0184490622 /NCGR_PEP_ID=MMETSP0113_2-20130426/18377_1 /TAXON_ID=91329 /ORGANISM="Norrisiella sphaerica, Strain BC52" /LENGTH=75 /DNA_ID=CAMNT_0026874589 /DNA_START=40 /DNA_END=264 /DNA_ORIENTATION=+
MKMSHLLKKRRYRSIEFSSKKEPKDRSNSSGSDPKKSRQENANGNEAERQENKIDGSINSILNILQKRNKALQKK